MSWAKLDDRFWSHPKVQQAWRAHPRAIGLHVMAITWCAQHETDGVVADGFLDMVLAGFSAKDRNASIDALTAAGLWDEHEAGWLIHDYLEFNESRVDAEERRRRDSERKRRRTPDGRAPDSERTPSGIRRDSKRNPSDPSRAPAFDPTRPDPTTPPLPPRGNRGRDMAEYEEKLKAFTDEHFPDAPPTLVSHYAQQVRLRGAEPTVEALRPLIERHTTPGEVPA